MRFYSFVKENYQLQTDKKLLAFQKWLEDSVFGKTNQQAGVPQIILFMRSNCEKIPDDVKMGFGGWLLAYFNEPQNMLPKNMKSLQAIQQAAQAVFFPFDGVGR